MESTPKPEAPPSKHPERLAAAIEMVGKEAGRAMADHLQGDASSGAALLNRVNKATADLVEGVSVEGKRLSDLLRQFRARGNAIVVERAESMLAFVTKATNVKDVDIDTALGLLDRARGIDELEARTNADGELCADPHSGVLDRLLEGCFSYLAARMQPSPCGPHPHAHVHGMPVTVHATKEAGVETFVQVALDAGLIVEETYEEGEDHAGEKYPALSDEAFAAWERIQEKKGQAL